MDGSTVTPPVSPHIIPTSPTESEISEFEFLEDPFSCERFGVLNLTEEDSPPTSPRYPGCLGLSTIHEDEEIVPVESATTGTYIRTVPAIQRNFTVVNGKFVIETFETTCGEVVPANEVKVPEIVTINQENISENFVVVEEKKEGEALTTDDDSSVNQSSDDQSSDDEISLSEISEDEVSAYEISDDEISEDESNEDEASIYEHSQYELDPPRPFFTRENFSECERADFLDLEQEIRRALYNAMAQRLITQSNSKLTKENVALLLTYPEAWSNMDEETKVELYRLLPTEFDGQRYVFDIDQHPLLGPFRKYVSHFLYEWQEDLSHGRRTARWEKEAKQASGERSAGSYDESKNEELESWWGQKYDPNFFRGPQDDPTDTRNDAVAVGSDLADSVDFPATLATTGVESMPTPASPTETVDVAANTTAPASPSAASYENESIQNAVRDGLRASSVDEIDLIIANQYESLSKLETRRDALAHKEAQSGDITILADLADSDEESFTSEASGDEE